MFSIFTKKSIQAALHWLLCIAVLSAPALINHYPLLYSDSGTYMVSSFNLVPPGDRPIGYGLFIRLWSCNATMWTVIWAQCMIAAFLIADLLETILGSVSKRVHLAVCLLMMMLSSLSWYANQIMPDVFTGVLGVSIYLFLFAKMGNWKKLLYLLLIFTCVITHFSHILIGAIILVVLFLAKIAFGKHNKLLTYKKLVSLTVIWCGAIVFLVGYNQATKWGRRLSPSSHVFLAGRFAETGLLKKYFDKYGDKDHLKIYHYRDSMPDNTATFLWAPHLSPLHKAYFKSANTDSCLLVANHELSKVTMGILTSPSLLADFAWVSLKATLCQFFSVSIGSGLIEYTEGSPPYFPIRDNINPELHEMKYAEQNLHRWNFTLYNYLNYIVLSISLLVIYCFWRSQFLPDSWRRFVKIAFLLMLANAFVTGSLANVLDRLQARITWPFVLSAIIAAAILSKKQLNNWYLAKNKEKE